jgi:hypothetical protein
MLRQQKQTPNAMRAPVLRRGAPHPALLCRADLLCRQRLPFARPVSRHGWHRPSPRQRQTAAFRRLLGPLRTPPSFKSPRLKSGVRCYVMMFSNRRFCIRATPSLAADTVLPSWAPSEGLPRRMFRTGRAQCSPVEGMPATGGEEMPITHRQAFTPASWEDGLPWRR